MRIHCDGCGREIESAQAIARSWDGQLSKFCSERCARAGRHLADDVAPGADDRAVGPLAEGDADEPAAPDRTRRR